VFILLLPVPQTSHHIPKDISNEINT